MKIAVIDSGVNLRDELLVNQPIESIQLEQGVRHKCNDDYSGHGTDIVKIICDQTSNSRIVSVQVLNNNNKGSVDALCKAIEYCGEIGVDVINLSLGLRNRNNETIQKLKSCCDLAIEKGITIISANHNEGNRESQTYPFAFNEIIGVNSSSESGPKITVDLEHNNILFTDNIVSVPYQERAVLRQGTSFLTPIITSLYCEFQKERNHHFDRHRDFMLFMRRLERNQSNLFFYRNNEQSYHQFNHTNIGYFYMKKTINDIHVVKQLQQYATVRLFHLAEETEVSSISKFDFLFFGDISIGEVAQYKTVISKLLRSSVSQGVHIVMMIPFMSIYQRFQMSEDYKVSMQSVYL